MPPGNDDPVLCKVTVQRSTEAPTCSERNQLDVTAPAGYGCATTAPKTRAKREQVINYTRTKAMQMGTQLIREQPGSSDNKKKEKKKTFSARR